MTTDGDFRIPVVNWSHGTLRAEHANKLECELLSDVENPKKIIAVLASDNEGHSYLSKRDDPRICNNFIVIRNRKTNAIKYFPTDQYLMSPYCASEIRSKSNSFVKKEGENAELNSYNLTKAMGSKRNKRRIMEMEKSNVNVDDIEKKLKKAIKAEQVNIELESVISPNATVLPLLPPFNKAAKSIEDMYNARELMSPEVFDSDRLESLAQEIMEYNDAKLSEDTRFSKFFSSVFTQTDHKSVSKVKMLLFADSLVQFLNFPARKCKLGNEEIFCQYSAALNEKLLNEFCSLKDGRLVRSRTMREKALCYLLVILLLINDFITNFNVLSDYVGVKDYQSLPRLLKAIGARSVGGESPDHYHLKLPSTKSRLSAHGAKAHHESKKR